MGFTAKLIILLEQRVQADQLGPQGEQECVVWTDSYVTIDFEHISRLEKLTDERFAHIQFIPFTRAGICVMDCFLRNRFVDFPRTLTGIFAPEILIGKDPLGQQKRELTRKIGGHVYIKCSPSRLKGRMWSPEEIVSKHNLATRMNPVALEQHIRDGEWSVGDPPLPWALCSGMADWLSQAELQENGTWKALTKDPVALAIARGWYHQLHELGKVGARALFLIS